MNDFENFNDIDELIGSSNERYFGEGYKHVVYKQIQKNMNFKEIKESFAISYPEKWSQKDNVKKIIPHFSTLDSLVLAVVMVRDFLREELVVEDDVINNALISKINVKAGNALVEDLEEIQGALTLASDDELVFKGKIASFSVSLTIELFDDANQIIIPKADDFYLSGFMKSNAEVKNISISSDYSEIYAKTNVNYDEYFSGIESASIKNKRLPSILDQIITTAELTEALHSKLDAIPRNRSKTLIMRKVSFERSLVEKSNISKIDIKIIKTKVVNVKNKKIRMSEMQSVQGSSKIKYSVAQEISKELENK